VDDRERWHADPSTIPPWVGEHVPLVQWRLDRLHALRLPVEQVSVAELEWLLDVPLWRDESGLEFAVRPLEVRASPDRHPTQWRRTLACDLSRPIHVVEHRGRWTVLDGLHRLLKATVLGRETIPAARLSPEQLSAISVAPPG
jgi:hypothetical protein